MRYVKKILLTTFLACAFIMLPVMRVNADTELPINVPVQLEDGTEETVRGLSVGYENNDYLSLLDLQQVLADTDKAFYLGMSDKEMQVVLCSDAERLEAENEDEEITWPEHEIGEHELGGWTAAEKSSFANKAVASNKLFFNGQERKYYTIRTKYEGVSDCFISSSDLCLLLNMDGHVEGDVLLLSPSKEMEPVSPSELEHDGYFQGVNSVLVGDATTGEIFYGYQKDEIFPIASTTKLMTYVLYADALQRGQITENDMVTASAEAEALSKTSDGIIPLKAGQSYPIKQLLEAALIVSSNECDHAISEYVAGDEETAVKMMNDKATELLMNTAEFYNCNGLPVYTESLVAAKKQNRMSSADMFKLASYILNYYPQIKNVTSIKKIEKGILDKELKNTNALLYNMPEVNGLKTGTTNKSGACLVTSLTVNDGTVDHDVVVVLLGAEGSQDRCRVSELMAQYGKAVVQGRAQAVSREEAEAEVPSVSANSILNMIVNRAMQSKNVKE